MADINIIITASGVDNKFFNKLAIEIYDWDFCVDKEDQHDSMILLSRDDEKGRIRLCPPVDYDEAKNEFLDWKIEQVEGYASKQMETGESSFSLFLLIDDQAKLEGHCVVVNRNFECNAD